MKIALQIAVFSLAFASLNSATAKNEKYEACLKTVDKQYHADWASECRFVAIEASKDRTKCQADPANAAKGFQYCMSKFPQPPSTADCNLPSSRAQRINGIRSEGKLVCREEAKAGL
ncbi:MAG: hypothetical protein WCH60_12335 [Burkholderiales bacterium]